MENNQHYPKKILKSTQGNIKKSIKTITIIKRRNYKVGKHLKTIKIKYCSTLRLIFEGVLPKPPLLEMHCMRKLLAGKGTQIAAIEPTIKTYKHPYNRPMQCESYDFTFLSDGG